MLDKLTPESFGVSKLPNNIIALVAKSHDPIEEQLEVIRKEAKEFPYIVELDFDDMQDIRVLPQTIDPRILEVVADITNEGASISNLKLNYTDRTLIKIFTTLNAHENCLLILRAFNPKLHPVEMERFMYYFLEQIHRDHIMVVAETFSPEVLQYIPSMRVFTYNKFYESWINPGMEFYGESSSAIVNSFKGEDRSFDMIQKQAVYLTSMYSKEQLSSLFPYGTPLELALRFNCVRKKD